MSFNLESWIAGHFDQKDLETREQRRARLRETFDRWLTDHRIEHLAQAMGGGLWRCARPNTRIHSFNVYADHGTVALWGDIGHAIFQCSDPIALRWWARMGVEQIDYALSKLVAVPHREHPQTFMAGEMVAALRDLEKEGAEEGGDADLILELCQDELDMRALEGRDEHAIHEWNRAWYEATGDCEPPSVSDHSATLQWIFHALRWWAARAAAPVEVPA